MTAIFVVWALLWLMIFALGGCVMVEYRHERFDPNTGKRTELTVAKYDSAMATIKTGKAVIDVNDEFKMEVDRRTIIYDPNAWTKIGEAIANGMSCGASGAIGGLK
jgi:hypothetical protein